MTSGTAARDQGPGTGAAPRSADTLVLSLATVRWQGASICSEFFLGLLARSRTSGLG
jgi:hypothetical protein